MMDEQHEALKMMSKIQTPTQMIISDKDKVTDPNVSKKAFLEIDTTEKKLAVIGGTDHYMWWLDGEWQRMENEAFVWIRDKIGRI